ncbi:MAG: purine-nucleoside phosphorylase [Clostridia bacterium]|nr:purine-nucleoside phosphorylase [Clostridia bacterium]
MKINKIIMNEIVAFLEKKMGVKPEIGVILGSGLGVLAEEIQNPVLVPYKEIPHFPVSTVSGHEGQFVFGMLQNKPVVCMQGRFHYYEGYDLQEVTLPIRVMKRLGITNLIVTNAAGGINESFQSGDLMVIEDHINLLGVNPLRGKNDDAFGPRFPDMSEAYNAELRAIAKAVAKEIGFEIKAGVYAALSGPTYETPAEIRYLRVIGADAVGMSTVPEVIVANHAGLNVLGISCITNMAAGITGKKLNHSEVMEVANVVRDCFVKLIKGIVLKM